MLEASPRPPEEPGPGDYSDVKLNYGQCPLCDSLDFATVLDRQCTGHPMWNPKLPPYLRWMHCLDCDHIFTDGFWTEYGLDALMTKTQPSQQPMAQFDIQRGISSRMIERALNHVLPNGRWLDVGFGSGALLTTAKEYGFEVVGLDLRLENVDAMQRLGVEAYCKRIEDYHPDGGFDVISLADVLEHVPFPTRMLKAAAERTNPNGMLIVSTPRMDCAMWDALEMKGNPYWAEVEHHHIFTLDRLHALLKDVGYQMVRYAVSERYLACMEVYCRYAG